MLVFTDEHQALLPSTFWYFLPQVYHRRTVLQESLLRKTKETAKKTISMKEMVSENPDFSVSYACSSAGCAVFFASPTEPQTGQA
jgi:hypothetical protein